MKQLVIMPGGFHPFHAGHAALYQSARQAFPGAEVYVAATNDTSTRPFPFPVKEKLAQLAGVAPNRFVQVKSPFRAEEIVHKYDPNNTQLIFVRSEKDSGSQPKPGGNKKDGSPSYLQPYTSDSDQPLSQQAYMAYLPTVEFGPGMTSATEIRGAWPKLTEKRKTALVMSLYPKTQTNPALAANVVKMLDTAIGTQQVAEAFDQPYKSKWEKSESGSYDALVRLPDGTNLSIMFNNEGDDEWQIEFYRNNSQEVTGEGDAQRIFATVLNAIQKFIKKHNPWRLKFSATKDVEPGQNSESRAKLYNRLAQRYATAWGYDIYDEDHGDQITYELTQKKQGVNNPVDENQGWAATYENTAPNPRVDLTPNYPNYAKLIGEFIGVKKNRALFQIIAAELRPGQGETEKIFRAMSTNTPIGIEIGKVKNRSVVEDASKEFVLYINDKPAAKYVDQQQALLDMAAVRKKYPTARLELKHEVCSMQTVKQINEGGSILEMLKPDSFAALQQAKQNIEQNRQQEIDQWAQDFRANSSKLAGQQLKRAVAPPPVPVAQPGEKHAVLKNRITQLDQAIKKQQQLDALTQKLEYKGLLTPAMQMDFDTRMYVRDAAADNYQALNQKLDRAIEIATNRLRTNKLAFREDADYIEEARKI
jgi:hypothetical protein